MSRVIDQRVSLSYASPPSLWKSYATLLWSRKPTFVAEGGSSSPIEAHLSRFRVNRAHVARYRAICGGPDSNDLPLTYPHVLSMPLHMALMTSPAFPVRIIGLIHTANHIVQRRPLRMNDVGDMSVQFDGHRDAYRGQEFVLRSDVRVGGEIIWTEACTYFARAPRGTKPSGVRPRKVVIPDPPAEPRPAEFRDVPIAVAENTGRRYACASGDFNPIHLWPATSKLFGFEKPMAHGFWSLARCAAEVHEETSRRPCELDAVFRYPVVLPSKTRLQVWPGEDGLNLSLFDGNADKLHLYAKLAFTGTPL